MKRAALLLLLLVGCAREDRASLHRRPISPAPASGWARLPLDAESQRQQAGAWIGDAAGRAIPFIEAREGLWESRSLPLENLLTGSGIPPFVFLISSSMGAGVLLLLITPWLQRLMRASPTL